MTSMSDPNPACVGSHAPNSLNRKGLLKLARQVHATIALRAVILSAVPACIIPPSLSVQDAGINSPPAITAVRSDNMDVSEPGPIVVARNSNSKLDLTLIDTDINDALYVRVFVDYTDVAPTAPRSLCNAPAGNKAERAATCQLNALCLPADVGQTRLMRIVVFDRPVLDVGMPAFMAMVEGGRQTGRTYQLRCTS